jgi:hypothetical protein
MVPLSVFSFYLFPPSSPVAGGTFVLLHELSFFSFWAEGIVSLVCFSHTNHHADTTRCSDDPPQAGTATADSTTQELP